MSDEIRRTPEKAFSKLTLWELLNKIKNLRFGTFKAKLGFSDIKKLFKAVFEKFNASDYKRIDKLELLGMYDWTFPLGGIKNAIILEFWRQWIDARFSKTGEDLKLTDQFALGSLDHVREEQIRWLYKTTEAAYSFIAGYYTDKERYCFGDLFSAIRDAYWNDISHLRYVAGILEKLDEEAKHLVSWAIILRARIEALGVKNDLEENTLKPFRDFVAQSEQEIAELKRSTDERLRTSERHSIQIIGIFAAIIAFIVTMVPTAVRLGGASIPIALAGLAIVTAGIIVLLAMIFGRGEKVSKGLIAGISIIGGLFAAWLVVTIWLAIQYPNIIAPQP